MFKKKSVLFVAAMFSAMVAGTSLAAAPAATASPFASDEQCYKYDQLITLDKHNVAGGQGTLYGKFSFVRTSATPEQAIKEIGWMTLKKGESIGLHKHAYNEDTYIIVSGHGIFQDGNGKVTKVEKGDITIARPGQAHALKNENKEPLVFLDIIAQNDTYQQHHQQVK